MKKPLKTLFFLPLFFSLQCTGGKKPEPFYLVRSIPLPAPLQQENRRERRLEKEELFYLLHTEREVAEENRRAIRQALEGEWEKAGALWSSLHQQDCRILNNLALYRSWCGEQEEALRMLERALQLCPDNAYIRHNYRGVLMVEPLEATLLLQE